MKYLFLILAALGIATSSAAADVPRYVGGDISLLPAYEAAGAVYRDYSGAPISDLILWLHEQGMNSMRVRVFVNPEKYRELHANDSDPDLRYDPNACQDIGNVIPLCRRITETGMALMVDFHYSDTWADPNKQWTPIDWKDLDDDALVEKIHDYTFECLSLLRAEGIEPTFIQPGNEISYGMLWGQPGDKDLKRVYPDNPANWDRLGRLLRSAVSACREVFPQAKVILHTERLANTAAMTWFYDRMKTMDIDYDIIGLSYYSYWHGDMSVVNRGLSILSSKYPDKRIMMVETGYPYAWEVPGSTIDNTSRWPYSAEGQAAFARDLVDTLGKYPLCDGLYWWWLEYNAYGTSLSSWYNAPLFDSRTGRATPALKEICSYATSGITAVEADPAAEGPCYDLQGRPLRSTPAKGEIVVKDHRLIITE